MIKLRNNPTLLFFACVVGVFIPLMLLMNLAGSFLEPYFWEPVESEYQTAEGVALSFWGENQFKKGWLEEEVTLRLTNDSQEAILYSSYDAFVVKEEDGQLFRVAMKEEPKRGASIGIGIGRSRLEPGDVKSFSRPLNQLDRYYNEPSFPLALQEPGAYRLYLPLYDMGYVYAPFTIVE